jgi:cold shock protein
LATGRVLQFDDVRGYGFIAADDGGEDVFLHSSVFEGDPKTLTPGSRVEFQTMAGDRGRKAFAAHLAENGSVPAPQADSAVAAPEPDDGEAMCDVLSQAEFTGEVTELLLESAPDLTSRQIVAVRQSLLDFGRKRGWVDA